MVTRRSIIENKKLATIGRIMGIDQASAGPCGFAFISRSDDQGPCLNGWHTEMYEGLSRDRRGRFHRYLDIFKGLYVEWKPDMIVIEQVRKFGPGGVIFLPTIAALSAVISLTVISSDCPVYSIPTSHWKSVVVGGMKKEAAIRYIRERFGVEDMTEHASEAACLALYPFTECEDRKWRKEY